MAGGNETSRRIIDSISSLLVYQELINPPKYSSSYSPMQHECMIPPTGWRLRPCLLDRPRSYKSSSFFSKLESDREDYMSGKDYIFFQEEIKQWEDELQGINRQVRDQGEGEVYACQEMGEHVVASSEDQRQQVAISVCSTPSDRSPAVAAAGGLSQRSPPSSKLVAPVKLTAELQPDEQKHKQEYSPEVPLIKKVAAEFFGTFILIFTVLSTILMDEGLLSIAASAGLAVIAVVLSIVHISGSHLNPAVSLAMAVFGHLPRLHLLPYAAAQTLGSVAAAFLAKGVYRPPRLAVMATVPAAGVSAGEAFAVELVVAFVLMFVITAVATDPSSSKETVAMAIAAAIMMNALVAGPTTGPSMNPARTVAAALATGVYTDIWVYLVATPLGAIAGAGTYTIIKP